jgi:bifunctional non-homologous end joining protein LigD
MLATLTDKPFDDKAWVFETKWDGFRVIASIAKGKVTLYSRNGEIVSDRYIDIVKALEKIKHDAVIDGELVALDNKGRSRFQLLQNALRKKTNLYYYVFDIMSLDGKSMCDLTLLERKEALKKIIPDDTVIRFSEHRTTNGSRYFTEAKKAGEEGIMAKRADSTYQSGKRSRDWLKIKTGLRQEFVIVGFTEPRLSRKYFGSLALAVHDGKVWHYVGHVGTGFDAEDLKSIHAKLSKIKAEKSPFTEKVKFESTTTWVKPEVVCEVKFTEWTLGGELRHPAFLGLREDKKATEVIMEIVKPKIS